MKSWKEAWALPGGNFITSAVLEYDLIMPGQTSPSKVMVHDNPWINTFRVNFKHIFGETIPFKDSSKEASPKNKSRKQ